LHQLLVAISLRSCLSESRILCCRWLVPMLSIAITFNLA
jgi:hypothetical protein